MACPRAIRGPAPPTPTPVSFRHAGRRLARTAHPACRLALGARPCPLHFGAFNDAQVTHFLSIPDEVDLYSVTLQAGETIDANIDAQQSGSPLASLLRVFERERHAARARQPARGRPAPRSSRRRPPASTTSASAAPPTTTTIRRSWTAAVPGGTTGLYTLNVTLTTSAPLMPDLTGSSFRTGVDMAAAGDTVPVSFTVQNRGGADPGNFQVQVLLSASNIFGSSSQVLATFTRGELVTGRDRPRLLVAGWLQRDGAGRPALGPGRRGPAHRGRPGRARGRLVRQERRPSRLGLGAADGRDPRSRRRDEPVGGRSGLYTEITGSLGPGQVSTWSFTVSEHPGRRGVEGGSRHHRAARCCRG